MVIDGVEVAYTKLMRLALSIGNGETFLVFSSLYHKNLTHKTCKN